MEENKPVEQAKIEAVESPTIGKLIMALAKAQGQIKAAPKDTDNTFFKSKYADLAAVWEACREPLSKNGLAVIQRPNPTDGFNVSLTTILAHESGEWIRGTLVMRPVEKTLKDPDGKYHRVVDPQGLGSCLTYARRYALSAMVGICSEEDDDDGNKASQGKSQKEEPEAQETDGEHWAVSKVKDIVPTANPKFVTIHTLDGKKLGTGDEHLIEMAGVVMKTGEEVRFHYIMNGRYTDLTGIDRREPTAKPVPPPAERTGPVPAEGGPKHDPHQMAPMAPSAGNEMAAGIIETQGKPDALGYIAWTIQGQQREDTKDMKFASKDQEIIKKMAAIMESKAKAKVEYKPAKNPRFAHVIVDARLAADDSIPF